MRELKWSGPNFIALLNGKQIFVLAIADKFALKRKCISQVSKKVRQPSCAFIMDLHCYIIPFHTVSTGRLACLFLCFWLAALWNGNCTVSTKLAAKQLYEIWLCSLDWIIAFHTNDVTFAQNTRMSDTLATTHTITASPDCSSTVHVSKCKTLTVAWTCTLASVSGTWHVDWYLGTCMTSLYWCCIFSIIVER